MVKSLTVPSVEPLEAIVIMMIREFLSTKRSPRHIPILEYRFYKLILVVCALGWISHLSFLVLFYFLEITELVYLQFLSIGVFSFCLYLNEKRKYLASVTMGIIEVATHQAICVYYIGVESQFHFLLALCAVLPFLLPKGNNFIKSALLLGSVLSFIMIPYFIGANPPIYSIDSFILNAIGISNILITGSFLGVFGIFFSKAISTTEDQLKLERKKSDDLLHNILPVSITTRLKNGDKIIADRFESVSVLFADIVGFTKLSERVSPKELVLLLNEIFSAFDHMVERYGLEKIKTIGDAYMVSAGLPEIDPEHANKIASLAIEMRIYIINRAVVYQEKLNIRIGIHSGPAIAGVIGIKKFSYDIWGDTINTASRMESHGLTNEIHVSETFKLLVDQKFNFDKREPIEVKGKGKMQTFFLKEKAANKH